jgi:diguanylate cyclase (GGDEF)-like protein
VLCLVLLTLVALFRRTDDGVFSILVGRGIGSRISRFLLPFLLILPFLREAARAHIINSGWIPAHYATAIFASLAAMLSCGLLLFLAWRIRSMEMEIHGLSLRDELTGLYNLKGFYLLAEQSQRMAHRSDLPFSVLFIDLDNLKQTNDTLGHQAGSAFLAETAELLKATFRETDVIGRLGGDEFAVAGQFSRMAISLATERLEESCAQWNAEPERRFALNFSVGHATSEGAHGEPLDELLDLADQAMYQQKRQKKMSAD